MLTPEGLNSNEYVEKNEEQKSQRQVAGLLSHGQTAIKQTQMKDSTWKLWPSVILGGEHLI